MNPPQMGAQTPHNMTAQRSQQSHGGTPRMPNATPNLQSTPLSRQVSVNQTPRMSQASPLPGQLGQVPHMQQVMGPNGQPINLNPAQQQQFQQQQALFQQRMRQQAATQGIGMNGQQMTQQQMMQAQQMLRAQQTNQMNSQMAQNYTAQMAAMQRAGGMPQNVNFANNPQAMQNLQQMQQMQQMQQLQQLQLQAQAQAQAQAQQHPQQATSPQAQQQLMMRKAISGRAHQIYQQQIPQFQAQYPGGIPDDVIVNLRRQCNQTATVQITQQMNAQRMQQQQQMMAAAQQHGGMQNGMGMQRPQ